MPYPSSDDLLSFISLRVVVLPSGKPRPNMHRNYHLDNILMGREKSVSFSHRIVSEFISSVGEVEIFEAYFQRFSTNAPKSPTLINSPTRQSNLAF